MSESQQSPKRVTNEDQIDLRELIRVLWAGKWVIGSIAIAATLIGVFVALMLPNIYRAEALLAPSDQEAGGGLSALAAQYGGLASLAGINLGSQSVDKIAIGLEILESRKFISEFIERHQILVPLMAAEEWDAATGELSIDPSIYDVAAQKWVRDVRSPRKATPSWQEAYKAFSELLSVSQDKQSGLVLVAVSHFSPDIAKQWVDWLIEDLNATVMRQDVAEAEQAIEYLNKQIERTSVANLQNVFFNLIEDQTKTIMLANVTEEYLLKTIDPAVAPEKKSRPKRFFIVVLAAAIGLALGVFLVMTFKSFGYANRA